MTTPYSLVKPLACPEVRRRLGVDVELCPRNPPKAAMTRPASGNGSTRAADTDRIEVAQLLTDAAASGVLGLTEYEDRLAKAYAATTYDELDRLSNDLPGAVTRGRRGPCPSPASWWRCLGASLSLPVGNRLLHGCMVGWLVVAVVGSAHKVAMSGRSLPRQSSSSGMAL